MEEPLDADLTYESLVHDLNNVFETITEAAELLKADKRWKPLAATLSRSVTRGKRLLGAIPDTTPNLAAIVDDAIESVTDYCTAGRKPRMRFVSHIPAEIRLPGSRKGLGARLRQPVLECRPGDAKTGAHRHHRATIRSIAHHHCFR